MAKGSYTGGGTRISLAKNPDWFGNASVETPEFKDANERHERAKAALKRILDEQSLFKPTPQLKQQLADAQRMVEATRPKPKAAATPKAMSVADEKRIADMKRDLQALANQARWALEQHEETRQKLIKLLGKHALAPENYPETRKLSL